MNISTNKRLCIFQMHYTDIFPALEKYNGIESIKRSGIFDEIVIACADVPENQCLETWASKWEVDIRYGEVKNITKRLHSIIEEYDATTIIRTLPQCYFIDIDIINKLVTTLESTSSDYIRLPLNYDLRFSGDVFSANALTSILKIFKDDPSLNGKFQFNPWGYIDIHEKSTDLKVTNFNDIPHYSHRQFIAFKSLYNKIWPEHWNKADTPNFPYTLVAEYVNPQKSVVLDIACGFGSGTNHLVEHGAMKAVGVDLSEKAIDSCKKSYSNNKQLQFIKGDALSIDLNTNHFDIIITIHTMEHVIDDQTFLKNIQKWLKKDGILVLEVPLLMQLPFYYSEEPYSDGHIREYTTTNLTTLFSKYFDVIRSYGVSRGYYVDIDLARNAALLVGRNTK
jgi:SAM-dependent methyltransferase